MIEWSSVRTAPVSVVIPCFRSKRTIARAIESIAAQTVRPTEIIVVDDGSQDGTAEFIAAIAARHPSGWIRIIGLAENKGAATARNVGWDSATQPFVAFLDADDTWHPKKIELQHDFMAKRPEIVLSGHSHQQLGGRRQRRGGHDDIRAHVLQAYRCVTKWQLLLANRFITPSIMVKRDVPYRFRDGKRYMEDHLLWLQLACDGAPLVRLEAELAFIHKAPFGESGLSARLWSMEVGDLENYWLLADEKRLSIAWAMLLTVYSLLKFSRRLLLHALAMSFRRVKPTPARP